MLAAIGFGPSLAPAAAAVPAKTDVMFIFDTSGSMQGVQQEAIEEIKTLIANTEASLPNAEFGVASVEDIPGYEDGALEGTLSETEYETDIEKPWGLWQALTSNETLVETAIANLSGAEVAHFGGDGPETYGRALYETATNPRVGWRAGARHEIVMIGDNVPHTPNVNEGIPSELQLTEAFNDEFPTWPDTGEELEGKWGIPDTQWKAGESLEFHKTLQRLSAEEKPLAMVDYFHTGQSESSNYIHYWEYWAAAAGGQAITAEEGAKSLDSKLGQVIKESAEGIPPCPPGYSRSPGLPCVRIPVTPPVTVISTSHVLTGSAPIPKKTVVLEEGELEVEDEFDEPGSADDEGYVDEGASLARFDPNSQAFLNAPSAYVAKAKKCKKGYVRKGKKCVSNKPVKYGRAALNITKPGRYKLHIKPSRTVLSALKKVKTVHVKLTLVFAPANGAPHITRVSYVTVHYKPKKKHAKKGKK